MVFNSSQINHLWAASKHPKQDEEAQALYKKLQTKIASLTRATTALLFF
jgi:hypothetical protein